MSANNTDSKSPRGAKLFAVLLRELHRCGVRPVAGDMRSAMRVHVSERLREETAGRDTSPGHGVRAWAARAAERILASSVPAADRRAS